MRKKRILSGLIAVGIAYLLITVIQVLVTHPSIGRTVITVVFVVLLTGIIFMIGYVMPSEKS